MTPEHLSERSKEIWTEYADKIVKSPARKAMLQTGLEALDRAEEARKIVENDGMIMTTGKSGVSHAHPAVRIEKDNRSLALKVFKALNIHMDHVWDNSIF